MDGRKLAVDRTRRIRTVLWLTVLAALAGFLAWRMLRPLNIFTVSPAFERPLDTRAAPAMLGALTAQECAHCHATIYEEWRSSMHSRAWTDPYFQADWRFDGEQQVCKNCHIPLDRQQEALVLGFRDSGKWNPILAPNPSFDPTLQHEGVTCAVCHLSEGRVLGPIDDSLAPHPIKTIANANEICLRCHVVQGERWDTFFRFPPCGTAAEIAAGKHGNAGRSGEFVVADVAGLGCVQCHMPAVDRAFADGGAVRPSRRHMWRGGHDPQTVAAALDVQFTEVPAQSKGARAFELTLSNIGAAHFLPTGTPDRHLTIQWRLTDRRGALLSERSDTLERTVLWRPFIVDLSDTRLRHRKPHTWRFESAADRDPPAQELEVKIDYHLLHESRRRRIGYQNEEPIEYSIFDRRIELAAPRIRHELSAPNKTLSRPSDRSTPTPDGRR
jgi:hypothetical protein